jgi:hypothetical protein
MHFTSKAKTSTFSRRHSAPEKRQDDQVQGLWKRNPWRNPATNARADHQLQVNATRQNPTNPDFCKRPPDMSLDWGDSFLLHRFPTGLLSKTVWTFALDLILQLPRTVRRNMPKIDRRRWASVISRINTLCPSQFVILIAPSSEDKLQRAVLQLCSTYSRKEEIFRCSELSSFHSGENVRMYR